MQQIKVLDWKVQRYRPCVSVLFDTPNGKCVSNFDSCVLQNFGISCCDSFRTCKNCSYNLVGNVLERYLDSTSYIDDFFKNLVCKRV